jgi:membrane-associated phospholipid phosphatase
LVSSIEKPVPATEAPKQAAKEIAAGRPGDTARRVLGPVVLLVTVLFAIDSYLVVNHVLTMPFDLPITLFVQRFPWGPLMFPMELINWTAGYVQVAAGAIAVVALFLFERRAGYLMLIGSVGSLLDNIIKLTISRQRPPADLVHILTPASGYSYPSGHAVFFTWLSFMLAFAIAPRVKPPYRIVLWLGAAAVIALTCLARVWAGDHWPSDVLGGVLLGLGWSAFVLWLPERWLPSPTWRWFQGRKRGSVDTSRP